MEYAPVFGFVKAINIAKWTVVREVAVEMLRKASLFSRLMFVELTPLTWTESSQHYSPDRRTTQSGTIDIFLEYDSVLPRVTVMMPRCI